MPLRSSTTGLTYTDDEKDNKGMESIVPANDASHISRRALHCIGPVILCHIVWITF